MLNFVNPWLLAALAGVGLPVLVHLLTRARPRLIRYPTYHLLVEAGSGRQALSRLRTYLVLALRTLLVAALVLLFARPVIEAPAVAGDPEAARRVVLVVDATMSMGAAEGGVPLFAKARAQAADVLRDLEEGSLAGIVLLGARPRAVLPALSENLAALHEGLAKARVTVEKGDPDAALALAHRMLDGRGAVYVFSDFQRTDWAAVAFDRYEGVRFLLRPIGRRSVPNTGITAVRILPSEPVEGERVEIVCTLLNASAHPRQEAVRLDLEGVTQEETVRLQPYGSASARFAFDAPREGFMPGRVTVAADDLPADDVRHFRLRARRALKVLVAGDADRSDASSAAFLVATALCPSDYARTGLRIVRRHSQDVDRGTLETADAFVLVDPLQLPGEAAEIIGRRVARGAYLIYLMDGPTAESTLSALRSASEGAVAPPFALDRTVVAAVAAGDALAPPETPRGPLELFVGPEEQGLGSMRFRRHFLTRDEPARRDEVLARFSDGSAALALSPAGRGAAVYVNFPVAPALSDAAGNPNFPALLHELLRTMRSSGAPAEASPGRPWHIEVALDDAAATGDEAPTVVGPDGAEVEAVPVSRGRMLRLSMPPADGPGVFLVKAGGRVRDAGVVNVDPRESDTRTMPLEEFVAAASGDGRASVQVLDEEGGLVHAVQPLALWPYLAAAAMLLLAAEMAVLAAWRRVPPRAVGPRPAGRAAR